MLDTEVLATGFSKRLYEVLSDAYKNEKRNVRLWMTSGVLHHFYMTVEPDSNLECLEGTIENNPACLDFQDIRTAIIPGESARRRARNAANSQR